VRAPASWLLAAALLAACGDDDPGDAVDGGEPDFSSCERSSECIVVPESCCGTCGAPVRGDAIAINADAASEYAGRACEDDVGCPACAPLFIDPTLIATCRAGRCELVDLQRHAASACTREDDCKVRTPDCCECGGDTDPGRLIGIATSAEGEYADLVCDPERACPECGAIYPTEVTVECGAGGHCETHDARLPR
jgi:hypothetical protein